MRDVRIPKKKKCCECVREGIRLGGLVVMVRVRSCEIYCIYKVLTKIEGYKDTRVCVCV